MAKKLAVLMTIVCIGLAAFVVNMKLAEDNESPEITFSNDSLTYKSSMSDAELLEDVRAIDNKDGDVSASFTIEDIYSVYDEDIVVVYVAKDNSNNISKAKRLLKGEELPEERHCLQMSVYNPRNDVEGENLDVEFEAFDIEKLLHEALDETGLFDEIYSLYNEYKMSEVSE